jgi:hypothetical protein
MISKEKDSDKKQSKILFSFISGGIAGVCSKTLVAPIERVKYLFIVMHLGYRLQIAHLVITHTFLILFTLSKIMGL